MTTLVYNNARTLLGTGEIDWPTCAAHGVLVNSSYSPAPTDVYFSAVPAGAVVADVAMTGLGISAAGCCYGVIPEFEAFLSSNLVVAVLIYINTGNPATSPLVYYSSDGPGFPFTPEGFNYYVSYDQNNGGYFQA